MNNIDWDVYFPHKFVISKASNFDYRISMDCELSRIGMHNFNYWYNCENKLLSPNISLYNSYKHNQVKNGHYSCIKTCYELGYDNVLIMEDDICFLNDINQIYNIIKEFESIKNEYDIILFDYRTPLDFNGNKESRLCYWSTCYYLNRRAMKYMIYGLENSLFIQDQLWLKGLETEESYEASIDYGTLKINKEDNILPIKIYLFGKHLCIQKFNSDLPLEEHIDQSLYNKF